MNEEKSLERLSKYLARIGLSSRRTADTLISQGRVTVNGKRAVLGEKVHPKRDEILVDGKVAGTPEPHVYYALNKPKGYLSTCEDPFGRPTVVSLLDTDLRVYPVGRLDYDTEGLLLLTNDGDFAYALTHPKHQVIKEYHAKVRGFKRFSKLNKLIKGVELEEKVIKVHFARFLDDQDGHPVVALGVHEGEKHLVRNVLKAVGFRVIDLQRVRIGPLKLGDIPQGKYRELTRKEVTSLKRVALLGLEGDRDGEEGKGLVSDRRRRTKLQAQEGKAFFSKPRRDNRRGDSRRLFRQDSTDLRGRR